MADADAQQNWSPVADLYLGRQPILDRSRALAGYELLFRRDQTGTAQVTDADEVSAQVLENTPGSFGMSGILNGHPGYINVGAGPLMSNALEAVPKGGFVLDILEDVEFDDAVIARCHALHAAGYRLERGLFALPSRHEVTPLVLPLGKSMKPLTRAALHSIVKGTFAGAAEGHRLRGDGFKGQADLLDQASAHWLRHTAGVHIADGGTDLRTVRDNLRHASLTSTNPYLHTPDDERHRETEEKHRIDW
jgi:hypothetical protein